MTILEHIQAIDRRWPSVRSSSSAAPVMLLAAGWRSGSTLLQRMLMRSCFMWGEPFGRAMPIEALARPLLAFTNDWPAAAAFRDPRAIADADLTRDWVANLYPSVQAFLDAQVAYCSTLFESPAQAIGFARWGIKEVRLTADHAHYLRWLFPHARLLMLYRDPYACYRSFRSLKRTFVRWPDEPIDSPERFGTHWRTLTSGFLEHGPALGARLVRYEDLCRPDYDATGLNEFLEFPVDLAARSARVGASQETAAPADELQRLQSVVEPLARQLGYRCPAS